jgi:hypothetical protein
MARAGPAGAASEREALPVDLLAVDRLGRRSAAGRLPAFHLPCPRADINGFGARSSRFALQAKCHLEARVQMRATRPLAFNLQVAL